MPVLKNKILNERLDAALVYGDMGWRVHPLHGIIQDGRCTCGNHECPPKKTGKHPRINDWPNQASCDEATIRSWWGKWPNSNVGIVTGAVSEIVVLDIDGPEGEESVKGLNLSPTPEAKTRRGRHLFFVHPGYPVKNRSGMLPGLDLRGDGGYVVAHPSKHPDGEYEWTEIVEFTPFPAKLMQLGQPGRDSNSCNDPGRIPEGQRNDSLFRLGAAMRHFGCNQETIESTLLTHNSEMCDPPLPDSEVKRIAASGARYKPAQSYSISPESMPKGERLDESNSGFNPMDLSDLLRKPEQHLEWVVDGYGGPGRWTLVAGPPKIGKTTLVYEAAVHVAGGKRWLKRLIRQGKVLVLAVEEHHEDVARRFRRLGAGGLPGQIKIVTGPLEFSEKVLGEIVKYIEEENIELVLVDTLAAWWHLENENDASQVLRSGRMLLNAIRQTNAAWICIVHTRKSGGEGGDEIRGSSAFLGLVDIAISMKRRPGDPQTRALEAVSRFSETPKELVIRYGENGYEAMGSPDEVSAKGKAKQVFAVLDQTPRSNAEIVKATGLSKQDVSRAIDFLREQVVHEGSGHKNDPFQYRRNSIGPNSPSREEAMDESNQELEEEVIVVD